MPLYLGYCLKIEVKISDLLPQMFCFTLSHSLLSPIAIATWSVDQDFTFLLTLNSNILPAWQLFRFHVIHSSSLCDMPSTILGSRGQKIYDYFFMKFIPSEGDK